MSRKRGEKNNNIIKTQNVKFLNKAHFQNSLSFSSLTNLLNNPHHYFHVVLILIYRSLLHQTRN